MKTRESIGMSAEYISDWSIIEAVREIVQNYLDARAMHDCDGYIRYDEETGIAKIKDYGPGMAMRHLVMGVSEKEEGSIGQFGEGLKLALLVFAREGRFAELKTGGKKITPVLDESETYGTKVLGLEIEDYDHPTHTGTTVRIEVDKSELWGGKLYFEKYYKRYVDSFEWVTKIDNIGEEVKVSRPGGNLWVNGSLVGSLRKAEFSYHLNYDRAKELVNRDREGVDKDRVETQVKAAIEACEDQSYIEEIIACVKDEEAESWEADLSLYGHNVDKGDLWRDAIAEVYGTEHLAISTAPQFDKLAAHDGYKIVTGLRYNWQDVFKKAGFKTSEKVVTENRLDITRIPREELDSEELTMLEKAIEIVTTIYRDPCPVYVGDDMVTKTQETEAGGAYLTEEDEIYISRKYLASGIEKTVAAIFHETVHKYTGMDDLTHEFQGRLTSITAQLMIELYKEIAPEGGTQHVSEISKEQH